jgi:hypothetical protein
MTRYKLPLALSALLVLAAGSTLLAAPSMSPNAPHGLESFKIH